MPAFMFCNCAAERGERRKLLTWRVLVYLERLKNVLGIQGHVLKSRERERIHLRKELTSIGRSAFPCVVS
jgi:hypothetical protein